MKTKIFLLVTLALLLTACAPNSTSAKLVEPRDAILEINNQTQRATLGSYCWTERKSFSDSTVCADMMGISTPSTPLVITQLPVRAKIHFTIGIAPYEATMEVIPIAQKNEMGRNNGVINWNPTIPGAASITLPLKASSEYIFQQKDFIKGDGLYIIFVYADWNKPGGILLKDAAWGDASYGFLIQVGAGNN